MSLNDLRQKIRDMATSIEGIENDVRGKSENLRIHSNLDFEDFLSYIRGTIQALDDYESSQFSNEMRAPQEETRTVKVNSRGFAPSDRELQEPKPNSIYVVDGGTFEYETDHRGRVIRAVGQLKVVDKSERRRNRNNQKNAGGDYRHKASTAKGLYTKGGPQWLRAWVDNGGHIFASMFGGIPQQINHVAQLEIQNQTYSGGLDIIDNAVFGGNVKNWYKMEQEILAVLHAPQISGRGGTLEEPLVVMEVFISYPDESLRPSLMEVSLTINGIESNYEFKNEVPQL